MLRRGEVRLGEGCDARAELLAQHAHPHLLDAAGRQIPAGTVLGEAD